jgi:alpha-glucosidase
MNHEKKLFFILFILIVLSILNCHQERAVNQVEISSPGGQIKLIFKLDKGVPYYQISREDQIILNPSKMGFNLKGAAALNQNFKIVQSQQSSFDETWTQPWGEVKNIRNHYNELQINLGEQQKDGRQLNIVFRVYDDGVGFRYEFPEQENLKDFQILDEQTEFALADDQQVWWIPAYRPDRYEYLFTKSPISQIDTVHTPLTVETTDGMYLCIHEAALTDYAAMTLIGEDDFHLRCDLVPWSDGVKVKATAPFHSPWRTIQITETPGELITSYLILNLNESNKLGDVSWVKPAKYVGIWWGMHLGTYTWASGPNHGATTANAKRYIDFAADHGFNGVLIEGWNTGWDGDWKQNGRLFNFTQPHPDFNIAEVTSYATGKGVEIIGHHETAADIGNYERQMEAAFQYYKNYGINVIKTGYVGEDVISSMGIHEWHHGQYMVRHYRQVIEKAAEYKIMLDVHEPVKDTGERRTYPNMMSREGARGQEFNAWSPDGGNPVDYLTILPFTRMLAGPMDYTPGIFDLEFKQAGRPNNRVHGTLAKELAIYVVLYSPLQMAADLVENYRDQPAFQFIEDVPVDWEETRVLHGKIGDYITVVRKDRHSDNWYLGSITDENARKLYISLSFLPTDKKFVAEIYADATNADWKTNPLAIDIRKVMVDQNTQYQIQLASGGGQAIRLRPAEEEELKTIGPYSN